MAISRAQYVPELSCLHCGNIFGAEIWGIVESAERPDLLERIRLSSLHDLVCPECNRILPVDAPLLLFQPREDKPLLFSPAHMTTLQQDEGHANFLLRLIRQELGAAWRDEWLLNGHLPVVPRPRLPAALGTKAATRVSALSTRLRHGLERLLQADAPVEIFNIIDDYPDLLSHTASLLCDLWLADAQKWNNTEEVQAITRVRNLLNICRKRGLEAIFVADESDADLGVSPPPRNLEALMNAITQAEHAKDRIRCIQLYREALAIINRSKDAKFCAWLHYRLALKLIGGPLDEKGDNLEQAIQHLQQCLEAYTRSDHPEQWAGTHNNLGAAYLARAQGQRVENLEKAIEHFQWAMKVNTRNAFPERWAGTQNNLGRAYADRIKGNSADNIETAIRLLTEVLDVRTRETYPADWAKTQINLASAYKKRREGERGANLEKAIEHYHQALQVLTRQTSPGEWASAHNDLSLIYLDRVESERSDNVERAIHHCYEAFEVFNQQDFASQWAGVQNNLANSYRVRINGEPQKNIGKAIHHYNLALTVYTRESFPEQWAVAQNNLGLTWSGKADGDYKNSLDKAIHHFGQALEIITRDAWPERWAGVQQNLGLAYDRLFRSNHSESDLIQAFRHYRQALKVYTREAFPERWANTQRSIAAIYAVSVEGDRVNNPEQAVRHFEEALHIYTREAFPAPYRDTHRSLGNLHFDQEHWERAHASYGAAIKAGADLLTEAYTEAGRRAEVGETARLYANNAYALVRLGQPEDALLGLEQGKTRLLNEALAVAEVDLTVLSNADQQALRAARQDVRKLEAEARLPPETPARRSDRDLADALHQARADLNCLIERIRAVRPDFLPTGLSVPELLALIPEGGALVAPLFTAKGSAVFVVPHGRTSVTKDDVLRLDTFTDADLRAFLVGPAGTATTRLGGWLGAYADYHANPDNSQSWLDAIETTGGALWDDLMGPVHERLGTLGLAKEAPVLLMPQGGLGLLPLHAAWRLVDGHKRYFLDEWTVVYAPSGYALATGRRRLDEPRRRRRSLLAVVDPTGSLPFAPAEVGALAAVFAEPKPRVLPPDQATPAAVLGAAPECNYLHFACHGAYDWQDPMQSGLDLAGGRRLTLADAIARLDLDAAYLVVLSACETGLIDIRQSPDEFLGLPSGFLQAGAPAVVSTLWPVDDLSTALLMERFYRGHLEEALAPAAALRAAQCWLRDTIARKLKLAERWEQVYWTTADPELKEDAFNEMRHHRDYPQERPFDHPYHWAAFVLAGA